MKHHEYSIVFSYAKARIPLACPNPCNRQISGKLRPWSEPEETMLARLTSTSFQRRSPDSCAFPRDPDCISHFNARLDRDPLASLRFDVRPDRGWDSRPNTTPGIDVRLVRRLSTPLITVIYEYTRPASPVARALHGISQRKVRRWTIPGRIHGIIRNAYPQFTETKRPLCQPSRL